MTAIGLELSPSGLRAVAVGRSGSAVSLLAAREVVGQFPSADTLTHALAQLRRSLPITHPVILGFPSTSVILTTVTPLIATPRRAPLAVQFELQQHLPFDVSDAAWHYRWLSASNGHAMKGRSGLGARGSPAPAITRGGPGGLGAVVAAMRRSLLEERLACCRRAGLTVSAVAVNPVATLNVWSTQAARPRPSSVVLLHLVNDQLMEWIVQTPTQLEAVPVAIEAAPGGEGFLQELAASWDALRLQVAGLPDVLWVSGSSDALPGFAQTLAERLRLSVQQVDVARALSAGADRVEHPERWTAALGLALQGLDAAPISLNLLADAQSAGRSRAIRRAAAAASGVCALVAFWLGVNGMLEVRQRRTLILQSLERRERLYQTLRPDVVALLKRQQHIERRSRQLEQLVTDRVLLARLSAQVAEALPDGVWLTRLDCTKNGLVDGLLEGRATSFQDVTQFLDRLKTVAAMTTVKPLSTNVVTDAVSGKEQIVFSVQVQRPRLPPTAAAEAPPSEEAAEPTKKPARPPPAKPPAKKKRN